MKINARIQWRNAITWVDRVSRVFGTGWTARRSIGEAILFSATLLLLAACSTTSEPKQPEAATIPAITATPEIAELPLEEEVVATGLVTENVFLPQDVGLWLYLQTDGGQIRVEYDYGEFPPCLNTEARRAGKELKEGDEIEVFGLVTERGVISVCDSLDYYLLRKSQGTVKEGYPCTTDCDCANLDCSEYPTEAPTDQEEGFCVFTGEKICWQDECTCQLICT